VVASAGSIHSHLYIHRILFLRRAVLWWSLVSFDLLFYWTGDELRWSLDRLNV
jgi:hypothetical protein